MHSAVRIYNAVRGINRGVRKRVSGMYGMYGTVRNVRGCHTCIPCADMVR